MAQQTSSFSNIPNNTHKKWYKDPCLKRNIAEWCGVLLTVDQHGLLANAASSVWDCVSSYSILVVNDASLLNGLQAVASWGEFLDDPKGPILGLYTATLYLPSIVTAYLGDFVSQRFGRRLALTLGTLLVLAGSLINALAVKSEMWVAESPRWLVDKNRLAEALAVLSKHHANNVVDDPLVQWELAEIQAAIEEERAIHQVSYLTPVLRSIGITSPLRITLLTSGLAIWNLILAFGAALNVERFGRRPLFLLSILGMLISYCLVMGFSAGFDSTKKSGLGIAVIPALFLYYGFYDIAWTPLPVPYTAEILPFKLRTKGLAIFTSVGTMANAFNQFVNPIALQAITWKYYAVYITILLFYLVFAYFMYPETRNYTIEEVSMLFDGPDVHAERLNELAILQAEKSKTGTFEHRE
ncbi:hypothetical protein SAPIO_CDS2448 [Scedosporium apiospermum]|uniref:Major facilitator superfamily (MFS) profile domain-containing protein n=1 Tax=Pseudallescheria apiosperma TaxID=563466 RepID=A0A084GCH8_PSEDA|nr:uncharacterized protein SAPIO_CDS2448 [Scedosporium apiospermum]KEZ45040.1 hypothetical protein SAPIO_CDS2448 [Scedosporium apiospermum]